MKFVFFNTVGALTTVVVLGPGDGACSEEGDGKDIEELHLGVVQKWWLRKAKEMAFFSDKSRNVW